MSNYKKIIFVCRSNTSRSPMAAAIFKSMEENVELEVLSRGSVVLFSEPINPKVEVVLNNHGIIIADHNATQLKLEDVDENTLVLTMSQILKLEVVSEFPSILNIFSLPEFVGEDGDVMDPYGGTLTEYESCYVELARLVKKTVYKINEK